MNLKWTPAKNMPHKTFWHDANVSTDNRYSAPRPPAEEINEDALDQRERHGSHDQTI